MKRRLLIVAEAEDGRHAVLRVGLELAQQILARVAVLGRCVMPTAPVRWPWALIKPGMMVVPGGIDALGAGRDARARHRPDRDDLAVADDDGAALDDAAAAIDDASADEGSGLGGSGRRRKRRLPLRSGQWFSCAKDSTAV